MSAARPSGQNLKPADRERAMRVAAQSLARGRSNQVAADAAGVSLAGLKLWKRRDDFRQMVEAEKEALLTRGDPAAVKVLEDLLLSTDERVRLAAALGLLREAPDEHHTGGKGGEVQPITFILPPGTPVPDFVVRGDDGEYSPGTDHEGA